MRLAEFDYHLPAHLIAREPCPVRDESRLLLMRRVPGGVPELAHHSFRDLPGLLFPGDLLVLNDTRVVPARLLGRRTRTGGKWEALFAGEAPGGAWELLCQARGRLAEGETLLVDSPTPGADFRLTLVEKTPEGRWRARPSEVGPAPELLARHGHVPLPPYILKARAHSGAGDEVEADRERYQTVYARAAGAVAAPTAGLHFTPRLFEALEGRGIGRAFVTLHVGPGTFRPVQADDVTRHRVEAEWGELPAATADSIARTRARGGRVVAVGTTSVRVLETAARAGAAPGPWSGWTELTICPPYTFRAVDALVTNFHLPRSSLLLLVSAFAGPEAVRRAYEVAVEQRYRFYSYGDAMLIL